MSRVRSTVGCGLRWMRCDESEGGGGGLEKGRCVVNTGQSERKPYRCWAGLELGGVVDMSISDFSNRVNGAAACMQPG